MRVRTTIKVERPPGFSGGIGASYRYGEVWEVKVVEEHHMSRKDFIVNAILLHEKRNGQDISIPGVKLGPETYTTLAAARKRARQWADVLSGQLYPEWEEVKS